MPLRDQTIAFSYAKIGDQTKLLDMIATNQVVLNYRDENNNTPLLLALKHGNIALAQSLIEVGAKLNVANAKKMTPLLYAIKRQAFDLARLIIGKSNGLTLNDLNLKKTSALMMICQMGEVETAKCLLANHAAFENKDNQGMTPFMIAALYQNRDICQLLLDKGCDINATDINFETALHKAALLDDEPMIHFLLQNNASTTIKNKDNETVIDFIAKAGNIKRLEQFLTVQNGPVDSLFFWAIEAGYLPLLEALLTKESEMLAESEESKQDEVFAEQVTLIAHEQVPWHNLAQATELRHEPELKSEHEPLQTAVASAPLMTQVAPLSLVDIKNKEGDSPLYFAVKKNRPKVVTFLLANHALVSLELSYDDSAIKLAFESSNQKCAEIFYRHFRLLGQRIDKSKLNEKGINLFDKIESNNYIENPLIVAVKNGSRDDFFRAIFHGADVNDIDKHGNSALIWAVGMGDLMSLKQLIANGALIDQQDNNGWSSLMQAAYKNHHECLEFLLLKNACLTLKNNKQQTALDVALERYSKDSIYFLYKAMQYLGLDVPARRGLGNMQKTQEFEVGLITAVNQEDISMADNLLANGANISSKDQDGRTPLMHACRIGGLLMMKYLIDKGACLEEVDNSFFQLIHLASIYNQKEVIAYLISLGVELKSPVKGGREHNKAQAIHLATDSQSHEALAYLLEQDSQLVHEKNNDKQAPLHLAAINNDAKSASLLMDHGALLDIKDYKNRMPIELALKHSGDEVAQFLYGQMIGKGVLLPNITNQTQQAMLTQIKQKTPAFNLLIDAVKKNDSESLIKQLQNGSNIEAKDLNNQTALMIALDYRHFDIASLLLTKGAKIDLVNGRGETRLMLAAFSQDIEMINYLLINGADPLKRNELGFTPLMYAVDGEKLEAVRLLLSHNILMIEHKNNEGWTALSLAIMKNNPELVACLCEHGASQNQPNRLGQTVLMAICATGDLELAKERLLLGDDVIRVDTANKMALHYAVENKQIAMVKLLILFMINHDIALPDGIGFAQKIKADIDAFKQYYFSKYLHQPTFDYINCYSQVSLPNSELIEADKAELFSLMKKRLDRILSLEHLVTSQLNHILSDLRAENKITTKILSELDAVMERLEISESKLTDEVIAIKLMQEVGNSKSNLMKAIGMKEGNKRLFGSHASRRRSDSLGKSLEAAALVALSKSSEADNDLTCVTMTSSPTAPPAEHIKIQNLKNQLNLDFSVESHKIFWSERVMGTGGDLIDNVKVPCTIKQIRDIMARPQNKVSYDKLLVDIKNMLREKKVKNSFQFFKSKKIGRSSEVSQLIDNCENLESISFNHFSTISLAGKN